MLETLVSASNLPNLHPLVLHFPIAIFSLALVAEIAAIVWRRRSWLDTATVILYLLAAVAAWATWYTGRMAADSVGLVPAKIQTLISAHADMALRTVWTFTIVAIGRGFLEIFRGKVNPASANVLRGLLLLLAFLGAWLLMETADRGGGLVYTHGVAVKAVATNSDRGGAQSDPDGPKTGLNAETGTVQSADSQPRSGSGYPTGTPLQHTEDGAVIWTPKATDQNAPEEVMNVVEASSGASIHVAPATVAEPGLTVAITGRLYLLFPKSMGDVVVKADLDPSAFSGDIGLVHHFVSAETYESLTLQETNLAKLSTVSSGQATTLDTKKFSRPRERSDIAVSAAGSHLKGYVDGLTVVHGHRAANANTGKTGLLFEGTGTVTIYQLVSSPTTPHH